MRSPHEKPHDDRTPGGATPPGPASDWSSADLPEAASQKRGHPEDVTLLEQLAEFSQSAGEFSTAMEYYEQIYQIAERARESSDLQSQMLYKMAVCHSRSGDYRQAIDRLEAALALLSEKSSDIDRCRIENELAFAQIRLGMYDEAEARVRSVTERILDPEASIELARAQKSIGIIAMRRGEWDAATRSFEAALSGYRLVGDRYGMAQSLNNLGLMEKNRSNYEGSIQHLRASLRIFEDLGESVHVGLGHINLAVSEFKAGEWDEARDDWERACRILKGVGHRWDVANAELGLGVYYRHKRDWPEAEKHFARSKKILDKLAHSRNGERFARELVLLDEFRGDLALALESFDEARGFYLAALHGGEELAPDGDLVLEAVRRLADLESAVGSNDPEAVRKARTYVERGLAISERVQDEYERGHLLRIRARIEAFEEDADRAASSYLESLRLHLQCSSPYEAAVTRLEYCRFCTENIIDLEGADRHLQKALGTFERIGAEYEAGYAYLMAAKLEMATETPDGDARLHLQSAIDLLERVGDDEDRKALRRVNLDIDRLLEESSLSDRNDLATLNAITARIHTAPAGPGRVREIEKVLGERLKVRRAGLFLVDEATGALDIAPGSSLRPGEAAETLDFVHVLRDGRELGPRPLVSTSPGRDPRFARVPSGHPEKLGSVAFMPLFSEDELVGGLYVDVAVEAGYFHQADLDFLVAFAMAAGLAVQEMRLEAVRDENLRLRRRLARREGFQGIVTQNRRMLEILDVIERIRGGSTTVLLQGETGTGKELLARAIHAVSDRSLRPLVTVNCAALSRDVLESELFGHVKGAFTDAKSDKMGLFEKADQGTIFLDEIDKTSRLFQERLLRVVDQGEVKPVGASQVRRIDVRILCATNRPLLDLVESGEFLKDLYYRLRVISIDIPPLRERKEDVPLLVEHFLEHFRRQGRPDVRGFSHDAMNLLVAYGWPGNVRDLRHEVERAVAMAEEAALIGPEGLSPSLRPEDGLPGPVRLGADQTLQQYVEDVERALVEKALRKTSGNRSQAARALGLSRRGLLNKIARYEIDL